MARRTYFVFHYQKDIFRVNVVRNSNVTKEEYEFLDGSLWEEAKKKGGNADAAIKAMIDKALAATTVTVVLIGAETAGRTYVDYEIVQSYKNGNGMLGVYVHGIKDPANGTCAKGRNPFDNWSVPRNGQKVLFSQLYKTYDWVNDDGYNNLTKWIEAAAKAAGK